MPTEKTYASSIESAEEVIGALQGKLDAISTYRCELQVTSVLGARREERLIEYAFKRPKVIRMYILAGPDHGSVLVYRDGTVRGHRGGPLSWLTLTYPPSHPEVITIREGRVDQSDFIFIQEVLRNAVKKGILRLMGAEALQGREHYRLDLVHHVKPLEAGAASGRFWIDQKRLLVSQYELYDEDGRLIYRQTHEKLELNVPLPEEVFKL